MPCRKYLRIAATLCCFAAGDLISEEISSSDQSGESLTVIEVVAAPIEPPARSSIYPSPISALPPNPEIDLQSRNLPQAQGDLSIRGGIFENSAVRIGASSLFDPQTGHYTAEIPAAARMLTEPEILTGFDNASTGFNSTAGTLQYGWQPIKTGIEVSSGLGDNSLNYQGVYSGYENLLDSQQNKLNLDLSFDRSESDGTRSDGDHDFNLYSGRLQLLSSHGQTDLFGGYQSKLFSWPSLYAVQELHELVGSSGIESEDLQTSLFLLNHHQDYGAGSFIKIGSYYRRHKDDYEFDRFDPGLFNPFKHETKTWSGSIAGRHTQHSFSLNYSIQHISDEINSTSLTYGPFFSRSYAKLSLVPEKRFLVNTQSALIFQGGFTFDDTNRDSSSTSPLMQVALETFGANRNRNRYYIQFSRTTQLPGYTALNSNPESGLFRGNPELEREASKNYEVGMKILRQRWMTSLAVFYRSDDDLVDWTYSSSSESFAARSANNVDIDTFGVQAEFRRTWDVVDIVFGYAFLKKSEDYGDSEIDSSFYALNYPLHRWLSTISYHPIPSVVFRFSSELRQQEDNNLRTGTDKPLRSSFSLSWSPLNLRKFYLDFGVDNLWDDNFQEVPGVPAMGRQVYAGARLIF
jgi:vitamin B12 transporter